MQPAQRNVHALLRASTPYMRRCRATSRADLGAPLASIFVGGTKVPWWRLYAQLNGTRFRRIATRPWGGPVRTEENYRRSVRRRRGVWG